MSELCDCGIIVMKFLCCWGLYVVCKECSMESDRQAVVMSVLLPPERSIRRQAPITAQPNTSSSSSRSKYQDLLKGLHFPDSTSTIDTCKQTNSNFSLIQNTQLFHFIVMSTNHQLRWFP